MKKESNIKIKKKIKNMLKHTYVSQEELEYSEHIEQNVSVVYYCAFMKIYINNNNIPH
jgi:hypothetical protein